MYVFVILSLMMLKISSHVASPMACVRWSVLICTIVVQLKYAILILFILFVLIIIDSRNLNKLLYHLLICLILTLCWNTSLRIQ